ncbi:hypothetical protein [Niabella aquatica]
MNPLVIRIKKIQAILRTNQTGVYDLNTINAIREVLNLPVSTYNGSRQKEEIQKKLGFAGKDIDGIFGVNTTTRIESLLNNELPPLPKGANMIVSKRSLEIIIESEVSSRAAYQLKYKYPVWPKNESGITIGIGYDLGYVNEAVFLSDWQEFINDAEIKKLKAVVGLKGRNAEAALTPEIKMVEVPLEAALTVFYTKSMPQYAKSAARIYPGIEKLPPDAQGALLSIVYNRGASVAGERRTEMKNIQKWVIQKNLSKIAGEVREMKRLWPDVKGLRDRREREAVLVENANYYLQTIEYVFV